MDEETTTEEPGIFEIFVGELLQQLNGRSGKFIEGEPQFEGVATGISQEPGEGLLDGIERMTLPRCGANDLIGGPWIAFAQAKGGGLGERGSKFGPVVMRLERDVSHAGRAAHQ